MNKQHILIVEDENNIAKALSFLLERANYQTTIAANAEIAIEKLAVTSINLVVLDLMLPGMNGYAFCQYLRTLSPYIPVIMLTAKDTLADKLTGMDSGADLYIAKPFEPSVLLAQINALFRLIENKTNGSLQKILSCGNIKMNDTLHIVLLNDNLIELTPKEYDLLRLFLQSPNQAFGRETLLKHIWGYDYVGDTRTVDMHIQRLRTKIEADVTNPKILITVRGFGYRLTNCDAAT